MQERGAHSICVRFDCVFVNRRQASASCRRGPTAIASAVMCEKHAAGASRFHIFSFLKSSIPMWCRSRKRAFSVLWGQQKRGPGVCLTPCFCLVVQCVSEGQGTPVDLPHHPAYDGSGHVPLWPVPLSSGVSAGRGTGDGCGGQPWATDVCPWSLRYETF